MKIAALLIALIFLLPVTLFVLFLLAKSVYLFFTGKLDEEIKILEKKREKL